MTGILTEKLNTIAENQPKIFEAGVEAGKKAEYDAFWNEFQQFGERTNYRYAFYGEGWTGENFKPKHPFDNILDGANMFYNATKIVRIPPIDFSKSAVKLYATFDACYQLIEIEKMTVAEQNVFEYTFSNCSRLVKLIVEGTIGQNGFNLRASTNLSKESITSIINALSTTTSGLSMVLSKKAKENAFTDEEWATLVATKPNWTISLA